MEQQKEILDNLVQELRRGTIVLGILSQLQSSKYGYSLVSDLESKGLIVDAGTLYPLLRRLEKQGVLDSEWETSGAKPRKYYSLSSSGREIYHLLCKEWDSTMEIVDNMIKDSERSDLK